MSLILINRKLWSENFDPNAFFMILHVFDFYYLLIWMNIQLSINNHWWYKLSSPGYCSGGNTSINLYSLTSRVSQVKFVIIYPQTSIPNLLTHFLLFTQQYFYFFPQTIPPLFPHCPSHSWRPAVQYCY